MLAHFTNRNSGDKAKLGCARHRAIMSEKSGAKQIALL
jgi:hypothetical protein